MCHALTASPPTPAAFLRAPPWLLSRRWLTLDRRSISATRQPVMPLSYRTSSTNRYWMEASDLFSSNKMHDRGKWVANALRKATEKSDYCSYSLNEENDTCLRVEVRNHLKGHQASLIIYLLSISSLIYLRFSLLSMASMLLKAFRSTNLPFASLSSSLKKPTPLKLDVSLPSLGDLQWSLARLMYLFNMQVERNVAV